MERFRRANQGVAWNGCYGAMTELSIPCCEIDGGRIRLRPFCPSSDAQRLFEICSSDETVRFYGMEPMQSVAEAEQLLACYAKGMAAGTSVHWAIVDTQSGILIGDAGIMSIDGRNRRASSYCILDSAYWGRGLSSDAMKLLFDHAFSVSPLNRIHAFIDVRNVRTIKSVEGIGFVREGVLRDYEIDRGEYIDDAVYALTRLDWVWRRGAVFGETMRKSRNRYSWQCYDFGDDKVVWVFDGETRKYHLLRNDEAKNWLLSASPDALPNGFQIGDPQANSFLSELRKHEITYEIHWDVTNECNSKCVHCYNLGAQDGRRACAGAALSDVERSELLKALREQGVFRLVVSGGEPLLHPRIFDLLDEARSLGFQVVLYTNGLLVDEETAERLAGLGLVSVEISMYGASAATHELVTRVPGSFGRSTSALRMLTARGVHTVMKCVALHANRSEIDDMLALGDEIADNTLVSYVFYPGIDGGSTASEQMLRMGDLVELALNKRSRLYFDRPSCQLCRYEPKRMNVCTDCIWSLYVNPSGLVFPCIAIPESLGGWRDVFARGRGFDSSIGDRLARWRKLPFSKIPECGKREYCKYCYSACPGDALLLHGNAAVPAANHCRLAIARYVAAKWCGAGLVADEWARISADEEAVKAQVSALGIRTGEYVVGGIV